MSKGFSLRARIESVRHALHGLGLMLRTQHNARIHLLVTLVVLAAGFVFQLAASEWLWVIVAIVAVWLAEGFNTAVELLADAAAPEHDPLIGQAKDVAAGAVLIAAIGAIAIGVLVFGPHLARWLP